MTIYATGEPPVTIDDIAEGDGLHDVVDYGTPTPQWYIVMFIDTFF